MRIGMLAPLLLITVGPITPSNTDDVRASSRPPSSDSGTTTLVGHWIRRGESGWFRLDFRDASLVEADLNADGHPDVVSRFGVTGDTVRFEDRDGNMCAGVGAYLVDQRDAYVAFDLIRDACAGRVKFTLGYWVPPDYEARLGQLTSRIEAAGEPADRLVRGRMYLALGDPAHARADLDAYLAVDSTDVRVWLNRAGTRFPDDLEGVVRDCDRAIALEPDRKTAYFLRGLARYGLGRQEAGCSDFARAIDLGFSVLRQAESERCAAFWM